MCTEVFVSTKLDAEKRLALQEEKQALEAKLLDVYVHFFVFLSSLSLSRTM